MAFASSPFYCLFARLTESPPSLASQLPQAYAVGLG
jgi:hypothetical protein